MGLIFKERAVALTAPGQKDTESLSTACIGPRVENQKRAVQPLTQRNNVVIPIACTITHSAVRNQAMRSFESMTVSQSARIVKSRLALRTAGSSVTMIVAPGVSVS